MDWTWRRMGGYLALIIGVRRGLYIWVEQPFVRGYVLPFFKELFFFREFETSLNARFFIGLVWSLRTSGTLP